MIHMDSYAGINFIHNHPHAHPRGFAPKTCSHPEAFASKLLPRNEGICWAARRGAGINLSIKKGFFAIF